MEDKQLLIVSIIGAIAFYLVTRYIHKRAAGTANELKIKKNIRIISIIYGVLMTIQMASLISELLDR